MKLEWNDYYQWNVLKLIAMFVVIESQLLIETILDVVYSIALWYDTRDFIRNAQKYYQRDFKSSNDRNIIKLYEFELNINLKRLILKGCKS